ncbi:MAG: DUF3179 domain-containing (seleno)protein [Bacteroidota bacterium]
MKKLYWLGLALLVIFEILVVWLIMPLPASQDASRVLMAWTFYHWRWPVRVILGLLTISGLADSLKKDSRLLIGASAIAAITIILIFNFKFTADHMFLQPGKIQFAGITDLSIDESAQVLAVERNGEAKAYPLRYLIYHHQVRDSIGGMQIMVTYCSVCRTGRIYHPMVQGKLETFRLAGMDLYNAMFEDETTGSWWRQANGEAIAGPLKGTFLPEVTSAQMTKRKFFSLYPEGTIMLPDNSFRSEYDSIGNYETGKSKKKLTGTDSLSWKDKSWVVGVTVGTTPIAFSWNDLTPSRLIHTTVADKHIVLMLSEDKFSFNAFESDAPVTSASVASDTLIINGQSYDFSGKGLGGEGNLKKLSAYQEFWHSWRTFHPSTLQYGIK